MGGATAAARLDGDKLVVLPFADVGELLSSGSAWRVDASADGVGQISLEEADFAPVVPWPEKVIGVGVNYVKHAAEANLTPPEYPTLFAMYARSLLGPYDDLHLPMNSEKVDWEVELGVIMGAPCRHVDEQGALAAIAGYTVVNDVSMRDWQRRTTQFLQGKAFEASTPVGPWLVTSDELSDGSDLELICKVDDDVRQRGSTSDMSFSVPELVSYISQFITLVPGDLIATGTPSGVGAARRPPVFLQSGNILQSSIERIGEMQNRCVAEAAAAVDGARGRAGGVIEPDRQQSSLRD
jgi:acylpyruvate hydrolase